MLGISFPIVPTQMQPPLRMRFGFRPDFDFSGEIADESVSAGLANQFRRSAEISSFLKAQQATS